MSIKSIMDIIYGKVAIKCHTLYEVKSVLENMEKINAVWLDHKRATDHPLYIRKEELTSPLYFSLKYNYSSAEILIDWKAYDITRDGNYEIIYFEAFQYIVNTSNHIIHADDVLEQLGKDIESLQSSLEEMTHKYDLLLQAKAKSTSSSDIGYVISKRTSGYFKSGGVYSIEEFDGQIITLNDGVQISVNDVSFIVLLNVGLEVATKIVETFMSPIEL